VEDEKLEPILENLCQTHLELASELGMTQQVISYRSWERKESRWVSNAHNAWPHKAKKTLETIADLGWEILSYATHSPDLAPDYYLFRSLQHHLSESQFKSVEQVQKSLDEFIESKSPSFFPSGIRNCLRDGKNI